MSDLVAAIPHGRSNAADVGCDAGRLCWPDEVGATTRASQRASITAPRTVGSKFGFIIEGSDIKRRHSLTWHDGGEYFPPVSMALALSGPWLDVTHANALTPPRDLVAPDRIIDPIATEIF
jgi:hypothetical protein